MFYREGLLAPRLMPKLENHLSSAVRDYLFYLFAATLLIGGCSSIRNLRMRHAVVTGTHYMASEHISVTNEKILHWLKGEAHIWHTKNQRRANWIGHILCRNCLIKHPIEEKVDGTWRWRQRKVATGWPYECTGTWEGKQWRCGELVWKRLWTCCKTDYIMNGWMREGERKFTRL